MTGPPGSAPTLRVPAYAWSWVQRSRPVLQALADRFAGGAPDPHLLERLRDEVADDPFVATIMLDVVSDVAFHGRPPARRPAGVSWDRGLTWWAATLVGLQVGEYCGSSVTDQPSLFAEPPRVVSTRARSSPLAVPSRHTLIELTEALQLLVGRHPEHIPTDAVRALLGGLPSSR